jgi:probable rRNA maturation factor
MTATVTVQCTDEQDAIPVDIERWRQLAEQVLLAESQQGELSLTFVDPEEMAVLNAEFMGHEGPTDVLSFPLDAELGSEVQGASGPIPVLLGDVVICPQVASQAASSHAGTLIDEIALLVVHGILHVLGHDHDAEPRTSIMRRREMELLTALHWRGPAPVGFSQVHSDDTSV